jgi:hypothetical protein
MMPIQVLSSRERHHEGMLISDFKTPTAKRATRLIAKKVSIVMLK